MSPSAPLPSNLCIVGLAGPKGAGKSTVAEMLRGYGFCEVSLADPIKRFCAQVFDVTARELWATTEIKNRTIVTGLQEALSDEGRVACAVQRVFPYASKTVHYDLVRALAPWTGPEAPPLSLRKLLQVVGTEWGKAIDPYVWIDLLRQTCSALATYSFTYHPFVGLIPPPPTLALPPSRDPEAPFYVVVPDVRFPEDEGRALQAWGAEIWWLDSTKRKPEPAVPEHRSEPRTADFEHIRTGVIDRNGDDPSDWRPTLALLQERLGAVFQGKPRYVPLDSIPAFTLGSPIPCGWVCPVCGLLGNDFAQWHCQPRPCERCGDKPEPHRIYCKQCEPVRAAEQALEQVRKATPIPPSEHTGVVWWPNTTAGTMNGDGYFHDIAELRDHCTEHDLTPPPFVYPCEKRRPTSDADHVIENALDEFHESAADQISPEALKGLQTALDDFWSESGVEGWFPDTTRVIFLVPSPAPQPAVDHVVPDKEAPSPDAPPSSS